MKILVRFLLVTSIFYSVHGRTSHHHHRPHADDSNPSIALPPMANDRAEEPSLPPTLSPTNSRNSTMHNISPVPSPRNSNPPTSSAMNSTNSTSRNVSPVPSPRYSLPPTSSSPVPSPRYSNSPTSSAMNATNSTSRNVSPVPSPRYSLPPPSSPVPSPRYSNPPTSSAMNLTNSTSRNVSPVPSPRNSLPPTSSSPVPSPRNSNPPTPSAMNSTNSTSHNVSPVPSPRNSPPPTSSPTNSTNSTSNNVSPIPSPRSSNSTSKPIYISPAPSPKNDVSNANSPNSKVVYNVKSFGAVGDGVSDDTEAFKSAWDSACQVGSAVVLAPKGYKFLIRSTIFAGPCQNGVTFQVDGTVMPPDGPESWPANNSKRQWLVFYRVDGMTMQGAGLIDGKGEKWWNLPCKPHKGINGTTLPGPCDSPVALRFFMSSNLTVQRLKIQNSPQFHFRFDSCHNVTIDSISISSPSLSPNTDGIHVENTNNVGIYNSVISNGDDCISIGSGSLNVDIRNVTCGPSHGISIGSLGKQNSRACVTNVTVRNAAIKHSDNGLRIKTWQGGSGSVSSITFDDIRMDTVRNPIIIDQYYCLSKPCSNRTANIFISDISYTGIKGTYDVRSPPIHLGCSDSVPCTNITLTDIELLPSQGNAMSDPFCWNVYGASQTLTIPPVECLLEGLPRSIMEYDAEKCY